MSKTKRISVPISPEILRELRAMSAENGRSSASNLFSLIETGLQKTDVSQQIADLKNRLQAPSNEPENHAEIFAEMQKTLTEFRAEIVQKVSEKGAAAGTKNGVFLPEKAARLLFEEALFSAQLSAEIVAADLPGTPQKPAGLHIRNARQKAKAALDQFISACREN